MWKLIDIESEVPLDEIMSALEDRFVTEYGPWPYSNEIPEPIARVVCEHSWLADANYPPRLPNGWGWTAMYRMTDCPRQAQACREAGVDPEGVYLSHFAGPAIWLCWVKSAEDADKLRLAWARKNDVGPERAAVGVDSPYIGDDQRSMYNAVLRAAYHGRQAVTH